MDALTEFKRMNFFTGFFTTADDWNQGQDYHLEKRKLHLRGLHTPGILRDLQGPAGNLSVSAVGGLTVRVWPGAALDPQGNLIVLAQRRETTLPAGLSGTVYLAIEFAEAATDWEENVEDPDFSGAKRCAEIPRIDFKTTPPNDATTWVELARIELQAPVDEIKDPANPQQPQANEINRLHVRWAGSVDEKRDADIEALLERVRHLHDYHLQKERRHNRGLFTAGIMHHVLDELNVVPAGGLTVAVKPGAALDGAGNEVYLDEEVLLTFAAPSDTTPGEAPTSDRPTQRFYVAARYEDGFAHYLEKPYRPFAETDGYCTAEVAIRVEKPANSSWIELARIDLEAGATEVHLPGDPMHPRPNEINRRRAPWTAARSVVAPQLPPALRERIAQVMRDKRRAFAKLAKRFPVPSANDVRETALDLETLARNNSLREENLPDVLTMLKTLEQDVVQEIGDEYGPVKGRREFKDYDAAVTALRDALYAGAPIEEVLVCQDKVTAAARELAEVILQAPSANAGPDQTVISANDETAVTLDASGSQAYDDQQIVTYRWEKEQ